MVRLFYDRYTDARRADAFLLGADSLTSIAAVFYATGALRRDGALDLILLTAWLVLPHAVTRFVRGRDWPREFGRSTRYSIALVLVIGVLGLAGWQLLWESTGDITRPKVGTTALILVGWCSGFLLFVPHTYRLFDFLMSGIVLIGMVEGRPDAAFLVPPYILGICLSSPARHQLFDVFAIATEPRLNLQNVRVAGGVAALAASLVFLLAYWPLAAVFGDPTATTSASGATGARNERAAADQDGDESLRPGEISARQIGFSTELRLSDMTDVRYDDRVVMRVKVVDADGRSLPSGRNRLPSPPLHWRGVTYSTFDPADRRWRLDTVFVRKEWPRDGTLRRPSPRNAANIAPVHLDVRLEERIFKNVVAPYFTTEIGPVLPARRDALYLENTFGDVVPEPELDIGSSYRIGVRPAWWMADETPRAEYPLVSLPLSEGPLRRFLELPAAAAVGLDLRRFAEEQVFSGGSVGDRLRQLRRFYARAFTYDDRLFWAEGSNLLARFLRETRTGDCVYFATSAALLLRCVGIPTRVAAGFGHAEWDPSAEEYVVRNSSAHAWAEAWLDGWGWYPLDPTMWVPPAGNGRAAAAATNPRLAQVRATGSRATIAVLAVLAGLYLIRSYRRPLQRRRRRGKGAESEERPTPLGDVALDLPTFAATTPAEEVVLEYHLLQSRLRPARQHRRRHQTPREHSALLGAAHEDLAADLARMGALVDESLYGKRDATAEQARTFRERCRALLKRLG